MRVAVWGPLPPAPSVVADHTAALLPALAAHHDVVAVVEHPEAVDRAAVPGVVIAGARSAPKVDLDVYQIGNSAAHVFAYREALRRPGVVVLHEWVLHDLVRQEAVERHDVFAYLREMRRLHGEAGLFVGRQVCLGQAGIMLPLLYPINDRLVESSLGAVTLTREAGKCLRRRCRRARHLHLPQHVSHGGPSLPTRAEARRILGLPEDSLVVTTIAHPTAEYAALLDRAVGRLRPEFPALRLVTGEAPLSSGRPEGEALVRRLVAADVVVSLSFPSHGEMSAELVQAMAVGRPVLVTAGTPGAEEMPEGAVVPIDPGPREEEETVAFLRVLLANRSLRDDIGDVARAHVKTHHELGASAARLAGFLGEVHACRGELLREVQADSVDERTLAGYLVEEVRWAARDLGVTARHLGIAPLLEELAGRRGIVQR